MPHLSGLLSAVATALRLRSTGYSSDTMCGFTSGPTAAHGIGTDTSNCLAIIRAPAGQQQGLDNLQYPSGLLCDGCVRWDVPRYSPVSKGVVVTTHLPASPCTCRVLGRRARRAPPAQSPRRRRCGPG